MNKKKGSKQVKTLNSLEDLRAEFGLPPMRRQTKDKEKLMGQRQSFKNRHKCPACETEMVHIPDTNLMYCPNKECAGFKRTSTDEETGETAVIYSSVAFECLDKKGMNIANNIFAELD